MIKVGESYDLQVPPGVNEALLRFGGINRFGGPRYRCVWGWSRMELKVMEWNDLDAHGETARRVVAARWEPKYILRDRFHVEVWLPPEHFKGPDVWKLETTQVTDSGRFVEALGSYPSMGEYESIWVCEVPRNIVKGEPTGGDFIWPNEEMMSMVRFFHMTAQERSRALIKSHVDAQQERKARVRRQMVEDVTREHMPAFPGVSHVALGGHETPFPKRGIYA